MGLDKKELRRSSRSGNSDSFWDLSSESSQVAKEKKVKERFLTIRKLSLVNVGSGGDKCEDYQSKSCIVSDDASSDTDAGPNPAKDLKMLRARKANADNADNVYKSSEISVTDAGNDDRDELEKLFLRLRERAKRNAELQISGERREKYINSEYDVTVPRFHTQNRNRRGALI